MRKFLILSILSIVVSACGFEPLYADKKLFVSSNLDTSVIEEMEKVSVETIADRFGQQLRNNIIEIVTPQGMPDAPQYRLFVSVADRRVERQALRKDITATREKIRYKVIYHMTENGVELFNADSIAYASYDIMANPYSTTMAKKKAEEDAGKILANDIALRVAAYFHSRINKEADSDF